MEAALYALVALLAAALAFAGLTIRRLRSRVRLAEAETARHFDLSRDAIGIAGPDGRLEEVNPAFEEILGLSRDELVGRPVAEFVHPEDRESPMRSQSRWFDRQGEAHWLDWTSTELPGEGLVYGVARDVTARKELELDVERLSQLDSLTGVFNRRRFDREVNDRVVDARLRERGGALVLIDLDRFKRVNEQIGREGGDLVLCEVARVLSENTRGSDTVGRDAEGLVARVGGDEFAVLLADVGPVEAAAVGRRLVAALERMEIEFEGSPVSLSASVGIAPFDGAEPVVAEDLLALADRAMYVVKAGGA